MGNGMKVIRIVFTFKKALTNHFFFHFIKRGIGLFYFVVLANLILLTSCNTSNLYQSRRISKISNLSYEIQNNKISENEIKSNFIKDSFLFLNPSICNLLEINYSANIVLQEVFFSCQKLDQIFESRNKDKLFAVILDDTINQLHYWDQKVRNDILQSESLLTQIKDRKLIDSIDSHSMNFINHYFNAKLYNVYLKPSTYRNLYILMLHNLGKEKSNDELILNLYLFGFEKGFFSKQDIFAAISRYLLVSTGKFHFNFDFLFENNKSTDSYQVKYSKEVIKRILSKNEIYGFNNR